MTATKPNPPAQPRPSLEAGEIESETNADELATTDAQAGNAQAGETPPADETPIADETPQSKALRELNEKRAALKAELAAMAAEERRLLGQPSKSDESRKVAVANAVKRAVERADILEAQVKALQEKAQAARAEAQEIVAKAEAGTLEISAARPSSKAPGAWKDYAAKALLATRARVANGEEPFKSGTKRLEVHKMLETGTTWKELETYTGWSKNVLHSFTHQLGKLVERDLVKEAERVYYKPEAEKQVQAAE